MNGVRRNGGEIEGDLEISPRGSKRIAIRCKRCGASHVFAQPYPYHAGFSSVGFLYSDDGVRTLVWGVWDKLFQAVAGGCAPWMLETTLQRRLERVLQAVPGGPWRFENPARCPNCKRALSGPITNTIYYLDYGEGFDVSDKPDGLASLGCQAV